MSENPPLEQTAAVAARSFGSLGVAIAAEPARHDGERTVVELAGELDLATAPKLRDALDEVVDEGSGTLVLDLRGLGFMDSTGLRVLLGFRTRLGEDDRDLVLVVGEGPVLRLLELTGLIARFTVVPELPA